MVKILSSLGILFFSSLFQRISLKLKDLSLLALSLILAGCGGGEVGHNHVRGICKSCKPYYVRGSWHYPQNHYNYEEEGLASWYGPGFHGKPKPYGELFDQNAMTAAHKTLPLPTVVLVTNLENGRSIKLIIDDRGPFVYEGRIIDLSMGAAKALDCYKKGTARVRVKALVAESDALSRHLEAKYGKSGRDPGGRAWWHIYEHDIAPQFSGNLIEVSKTDLPSLTTKDKPEPPKSTISPSMTQFLNKLDTPLVKTPSFSPASKKILPPKASQLYVDLKAHFVQKRNAEEVLRKIQAYYPARIIEIKHPSGQKFYSVSVGPFTDEKSAQIAVKRLAELGQSSAIISSK
jgi:rare lipoprotein A